MAKIEYGRIVDVNNNDLKKLNKNPKKFWKDVKFLGEGAFKNCSDLKEISIPKTIEMAYENPFEGCENLERIYVDEACQGLTTDGRALFYVDGKFLVSYANASGETYNVPKGVIAISSSAFKNCKNLKRIVIPKTVESIGWGAFENSGLTEILIPETVKTVDCDAFKNCQNLNVIKIQTKNVIIKVEPKLFNELLEDDSDMKKVVAKIKIGKQIAETMRKYQPVEQTQNSNYRKEFKSDLEKLLGPNFKPVEEIRTKQQAENLFKKYGKSKGVEKEENERQKTFKRILNLVNDKQDDQGK